MIRPIASQPALIDQVHDSLVAAIADGTLRPGERLTQENMAEMLGVSRQPVSHALQLLRLQGLAIETGKRGLVVAPMNANRLLELYQVRATLEGLAARLAATRIRDGHANDEEKDAFVIALRQGSDLKQGAGVQAMIAADVAFHTVLHRLSGNSAIVETVDNQWPHFKRAMGSVLANTDRCVTVWAEHEKIADLVLSGKPEQAEDAILNHIESAAKAAATEIKFPEAAE